MPLDGKKKLAVVGPFATSRALLSDYAADEICPGATSTSGVLSCITPIGAALQERFPGATVVPGVGVSGPDSASSIGEAVAAAKAADQIVLAVGIDRTIEHEGQDRKEIALPGLQPDLVRQILALKKPTVRRAQWIVEEFGIMRICTLPSTQSRPSWGSTMRFEANGRSGLWSCLRRPSEVFLMVNGGVLGVEEFVPDAPAVVEAYAVLERSLGVLGMS